MKKTDSAAKLEYSALKGDVTSIESMKAFELIIILPWRLIRGICRWVMEPIIYTPKLATLEEICEALETAPESRIERFYLQVMERGDTLELIAHIEQLKKKIQHDRLILASKGQGEHAKEYQERYEFISACHLQHMDTVTALDKRLKEVKELEAASVKKK